LQRTLFATGLIAIGLILMAGFWAIAGYSLTQDTALSRDYNANCTPPLFPLRGSPPSECTNLSAQMGEASAYAFVAGVVGFLGMIIALIGATREPEP
jgi:hypothetical protein